MEKIIQKDFIEIEFTGKVKDGNIFDSNIKEDLEKTKLDIKAKPFIFCIKEKMFLEGVENFLIGKQIGKEYEIELSPEKAFGNRNPSLIKKIPIKIFQSQKVVPQPGMMFNFDNQIGRIISVSGGRVITDFNNPLAGKTIIYKIKTKRKVTDINEKVKALINFFFRKDFDFEIKDKKLIIKTEKQFAQFMNLFKEKFKEILGLELEVKGEKDNNPQK